MKIAVCICTFKRPFLLKNLLKKLVCQETNGEFTHSVIVVDNDSGQSAKAIVEEERAIAAVPIQYLCEPEQNIALARNRALANADGDFIAMIDDDEVPPGEWLLTMVRFCLGSGASGVLGPVRPSYEGMPPEWFRKGKFAERPEHKTGYVLNWRETRTGNVMIRKEILQGLEQPFRAEFGQGGEDQDFFRRLLENGRLFLWCNEAPVYEHVPRERLTRSYLITRALSRGQNERFLAKWNGIGKSLLAVPIYMVILPFVLAAGHHRFIKYLVKLCDHVGRLLGVVGLTPVKIR